MQNKAWLRLHLKTILAVLWFAFTFSLVAWWWTFFLMNLNTTEESHRMFAWEGSILLAAILLGGISLVIFTYRDQQRHKRLRFFFSTFSHDIKTSITRLRLQAEVLEEEEKQNNPILLRLIEDIQRLDLQLENSLLLANLDAGTIFLETLSLQNLISRLRVEFPELSLELSQDISVLADQRALVSVFKNLLQNAVIHGKASRVRIEVQSTAKQRVRVTVVDNGAGFAGRHEKLGSEILKSQNSQSNGIGLLLSKRLMQKMNGDLSFRSSSAQGFEAQLILRGPRP